MKLLVSRIREEADGIVSLELRHADDLDLPAWTPGAHIDLTIRQGLVRQYSLCGDVSDVKHYRIAVLREPTGRGGSVAVHDDVRVGHELEVSYPRNHFPLVPSHRYLFIAGGIGITPILPMIAQAERAGSAWHLHYGGRRRSSMAFSDQFACHAAHVDYWPENERGLLPLDSILRSARDAEIYACGPGGLLNAIIDHSIAAGFSERLHIERFAPTANGNEANLKAEEFVAVIASTGQEVPIPADRSLLHCLLDAGVDVLYSCEEGMCGSCETRVLAGTPLHLDSVLTPQQRDAGDRIMPCVSRSLSKRLTLDL